MQGFHTAIEHFRETGEILDWNNWHACVNQGLCRTAGGKNFYTEYSQAASKLNNSAFVAHTNERTAYFCHAKLLGNRLWR
jgi:hypothetical protein